MRRRRRSGGEAAVRDDGQPTGRAAAEAEARRRKREEQRRKLFMQSAAGDDDDAFDEDKAQTLVQQFVERLRRFVRRHMPLQKEMRSVEARYGTSVSAYFGFLRWIVINYVLLGTVCTVSLVLHVMHLYNDASVSLSDELTLEGLLPRVVLISSYQSDEAFGYAAVLVGCNLSVAANSAQVGDGRLSREGEGYIRGRGVVKALTVRPSRP